MPPFARAARSKTPAGEPLLLFVGLQMSKHCLGKQQEKNSEFAVKFRETILLSFGVFNHVIKIS